MQILLSCAKTMTSKSKVQVPQTTQPINAENAAVIAFYMAQRSVDELEEILHISPKIALENQQRYQVFHASSTPAMQALLAYTGIVFKRIDPSSFTNEDFLYAQEHLWLTSFCYGLLRPLDLIKNYRLEGDVILDELGNITLFDYWKDILTDVFIQSIKEKGGILCNLASDEMKRLFHWKKVESSVRIITPEFKVWKGDKLKTIVVYTKMCRGEMTRFILQNKITEVEDLKLFSWEGFTYEPVLSKGDNWVFVSDQK